MYTIPLNESGTRRLDVAIMHLETIRRYALFRDLVDSSGYVTEEVLDKLKHHIRALIAADGEATKELLALCSEVVYHEKMKAYGLRQLILAYLEWEQGEEAAERG